MAKKDTDPPEAVAARDREPTPEGQRDSAIAEQIAADAGQDLGPGTPAPTNDGQAIEQEITDQISGQDLKE